jgi:D-serine/D-alanine/glycine transporter
MRSLGELLLSNLEYHSFVDFVRDYLGDMAALITGWTYWFCWISLAMADLTAVGLYTQYWLPDVPQWLPGLIALLILLIMNLATVKLFGELEFWFALIKVIAILALIVIGLFMIFKGFPTHSGAALSQPLEPRRHVSKWTARFSPFIPDGCLCVCWHRTCGTDSGGNERSGKGHS